MTSDQSKTTPSRRRLLLAALAICLGTGLLAGSPRVAGWWLRRQAASHLDNAAIPESLAALRRAERWQPVHPSTPLLQAAAFRMADREPQWKAALEAADSRSAPADRVNLERRLGETRWGKTRQLSASDVASLRRLGASSEAAATAVLQGLLVQNNLRQAEQVLEQVKDDGVRPWQGDYLRGCLAHAGRSYTAAAAAWQQTLRAAPLHFPARRQLARMFEERSQLVAAEEHYQQLFRRDPADTVAVLDLARLHRAMGRPGEARILLGTLPTGSSSETAVQWGELEYECGNYAAAVEWFERANLSGAHQADTLRTAASAYALAGHSERADELFQRVADSQSAQRRISELRTRLALDPGDPVALREWTAIAESAVQEETPAATTSPLFRRHCGACHGPTGRGNGPAARHLYPPPRDLVRDAFRLISTTNAVPTAEDVERVIREGVPGTSMPAFGELDPPTVAALVAETLALRDPGESLHEPQPWHWEGTPSQPDEAALQRGRSLYVQLGCIHCHGSEGRGDGGLLLWDAAQRPAIPRDLTRDPMKGGREVPQLLRRIRLGMPGTPHPAAVGLTDQQLIDLVHYCRSLAVGAPQELTNYERARRADQYVQQLLAKP